MFFSLQAQEKRKHQSSFGIETPIQKPYRVPNAVVAAIKSQLEYELRGQLEGSLVYLNNDRKAELLVQGNAGANITSFWLFRRSHGEWKQILQTVAAWVAIENSRRKGFRNVSILAASAVTAWGSQYRFNGSRYVPVRCWEEAMGGKNRRKGYFRCSGDSIKPYR